METIQVKVGQVWQDCDKRFPNRRIRVLEIVGEKAVVQSVHGFTPKTRIRLDRFRPGSTGYRLVQDV